MKTGNSCIKRKENIEEIVRCIVTGIKSMDRNKQVPLFNKDGIVLFR